MLARRFGPPENPPHRPISQPRGLHPDEVSLITLAASCVRGGGWVQKYTQHCLVFQERLIEKMQRQNKRAQIPSNEKMQNHPSSSSVSSAFSGREKCLHPLGRGTQARALPSAPYAATLVLGAKATSGVTLTTPLEVAREGGTSELKMDEGLSVLVLPLRRGGLISQNCKHQA